MLECSLLALFWHYCGFCAWLLAFVGAGEYSRDSQVLCRGFGWLVKGAEKKDWLEAGNE